MDRKDTARLLIADSHKFVADACKQMLEPEFDVVGIVSDGRALMQMALRLKPDLVILEIALPQLNGLGAAEQIKRN
jgi:DNA-binding NarL/FixJ family response regulator